MLPGIALLAVSLFGAQAEPVPTPPAPFAITWYTNTPQRVTVCGSNILATIPQGKAGEDIFQIHVDPDDPRAAIGLPAVSGITRLDKDCFHFLPQFPFQPGIRYRATFSPSGQKPISSTFEIAREKPQSTTVVSKIFPSAELLPENLLKFYLYFSAPMSGGHIYEHIQLTNDRGEPVELPFLEIDEELWNSDMTRLTLFLDPGRIKTGVKPLEEVGPALESGKSYILTIAREWRDARGAPLKEPFQKKFRVGEADREPPDHARWKIKAPKAGTHDPLQVKFNDSLDHALALRMIQVENVTGEKKLSQNEKLWSFTPSIPWAAGSHRIQVQNTIEDLAGNNIGKPFEVDLFSGVQKRITHEAVTREFVVE